MKRKNIFSGAPLELKAGYCRAVKIGDIIHIGGTTAVQPDGSVWCGTQCSVFAHRLAGV